MPQHSRVLEYFTTTAWALHPPVHESLRDIVVRHARGVKLDDDAIAAAIGRDPTPDLRAAADDGEIGDRFDRLRRQRMLDYLAEQEHIDRSPPTVLTDIGAMVIPMRGVMARFADQVNRASQPRGRSSEGIRADLQAAIDDPDLHTVVLHVHSPGGDVFGTEETAQAVRNAREAGLRVIAVVDGLAASAALWIATAADEVVLVGQTTGIGSLGVITARVVYGDKTREVVDIEVFRSVDLKAPGSFGEQLDDQQRAEIKRYLGQLHQIFRDTVQVQRGLSDEQIAEVATGQVFFGADAVAKGLADRIASMDEVLLGLVQTPPSGQGLDITTSDHEEQFMNKDEIMALINEGADPKLVASLDQAGLSHDQAKGIITAMQAAVDKHNAKMQAMQAEHQTALADKDQQIADLQAKVDQLGALGRGSGADAGADHTEGGQRTAEDLRAEWESDADLRAGFALGGFASYVEHLCLEGQITDSQRARILADSATIPPQD